MTAANVRSMKYGGYHRRRDAKADAELTHVRLGNAGRRVSAALLATPWHSPPSSASSRLPSAFLARTWWCSATAAAASASWNGAAATATRPSNTASSRNAASGAATTAGFTTSTAPSWRRRASRRAASSRTSSATAPILSTNTPGWSLPIWARPKRSQNFPIYDSWLYPEKQQARPLQAAQPLPLATGPRERGRPHPHLLPARARFRDPVQRALPGTGRARVLRDAARRAFGGDAALERIPVDPRQRRHPAQRRPVRRRLHRRGRRSSRCVRG